MSVISVERPTLEAPGAPVPAYASWTRRVIAYFLDAAVLAGVMFVTTGRADSPGLLPFFSPPTEFFSTGATAPQDATGLLATGLLFLLLQAWTGATPGKRVVGITVVRDDDGRPAGVVRTVLRWLAHFIDAIFFVGYLRPLWHKEGRTVADSLLSTVVVTHRKTPSGAPQRR